MLINANAQERLTVGYDVNLPDNERKCILLPEDCDNLNHYWECYLRYKEEGNLSRIFKTLSRMLFYFSANVEEVFLVNNIRAYDDLMELFTIFTREIRFVNGQRFSDDDGDKLTDILRDIGEIGFYIKKSKLLCEEVKRQYDGSLELRRVENKRNKSIKSMYSMKTFILGGVVIGCIIGGVVLFCFGPAAVAATAANSALAEAVAAGAAAAEIQALELAVSAAYSTLYAYVAGGMVAGGIAGGVSSGVVRTSYTEKELKTLIDIKDELIKKLKQHYAVYRAASGPDDELKAVLFRNRNILFVNPVVVQKNESDKQKEQEEEEEKSWRCALL